jgi:hypothetical protein
VLRGGDAARYPHLRRISFSFWMLQVTDHQLILFVEKTYTREFSGVIQFREGTFIIYDGNVSEQGTEIIGTGKTLKEAIENAVERPYTTKG